MNFKDTNFVPPLSLLYNKEADKLKKKTFVLQY